MLILTMAAVISRRSLFRPNDVTIVRPLVGPTCLRIRLMPNLGSVSPNLL